MRASWREELSALARESERFGIRLDEPKQDQIAAYLHELLRWNERINLTAITNPSEILVKHVLDSLVPASLLATEETLVDIGTGAGFPGIPIKIARPGIRLVLVESRGKKCSFLEHACRTLGLESTEVRQERAEDRALLEHFSRSPADAMITRAALKDEPALKAGKRIVSDKGRILLMKGSLGGSDFDRLREAAERSGTHIKDVLSYRLAGMKNERNVVVLEPITH